MKKSNYLHGVFFLSERGLVPLQRRRDDSLLTAHRCWREGWILQVVTVLLRPHVEELKEHRSSQPDPAQQADKAKEINHEPEMERRVGF